MSKELTEERLMDLPRGIRIKLKDSHKGPQIFKDGGILVHQSKAKYDDDKLYGIKTLIGTCYEFNAEDYELMEGDTFLDIYEKIGEFEYGMGESFPDYFMHDNVNDQSWAFWLLGKGYVEQAHRIIDEILAGETCLDQDVLYDVYPVYNDDGDFSNKNYYKNMAVWAEFLSATPFYTEKVYKFFKEHEDEFVND